MTCTGRVPSRAKSVCSLFVYLSRLVSGCHNRASVEATTLNGMSSPSRLGDDIDRKSTRLNSSHTVISYAVFCLKKNKKHHVPVHSVHRTNRSPSYPFAPLPSDNLYTHNRDQATSVDHKPSMQSRDWHTDR